MEKLDLHGKAGFIIGGTRGIGNAIAMRMARLGMNLTVIARKEDELAAMKAQVEPLGVRRTRWACRKYNGKNAKQFSNTY